MLIPADVIAQIREASDIVEVVQDHVRLKKAGANYVGLCPFHSERTPSFNVHPAKGIFKCFGCDKGGDVFNFIMEIDRVEFVQAVRTLAQRAGISIPSTSKQRDPHEAVYSALRFAAEFYKNQLAKNADQGAGARYLQGRGLTDNIVRRFQLGYAPKGWNHLLEAASRARISVEVLRTAGLIIEREDGRRWDRFRGRIMFPIWSRFGRLVGFGGRALAADQKGPKYINSPETPVYKKNQVLYGLYQAKSAAKRAQKLFMVEGYTDVLALHQAGIENVAACCGTALTEQQVNLIKTYVGNVVLLYDADEAGQKAASRAMDIVLGTGIIAHRATLPPGSGDPDEFVRKVGAETFEREVNLRTTDFVHGIVQAAEARGEMTTPVGRLHVRRLVLRKIAQIDDPIIRQEYLSTASQLLSISEDQLARELRQESTVPVSQPDEAPQPIVVVSEAETELLRTMLEEGSAMVEYVMGHMALDEFTPGPARDLVQAILDLYHEHRAQMTEAVKRGLLDVPRSAQQLLAHITLDRHQLSSRWESMGVNVPDRRAVARKIAHDAMVKLKTKAVEEQIAKLQNRLLTALDGSPEQSEIQARLINLLDLKQGIIGGKYVAE